MKELTAQKYHFENGSGFFEHSLDTYLRLSEKQKAVLFQARFKTVRDLLWHFPSRYESFRALKTVANLADGDEAAISGKVINSKILKTWRKRLSIAETSVSDGTGTLRVVWFNQPYMANILSPEKTYSFSGKVKRDKKGLYLANPDYKEGEVGPEENPEKPGLLIPIYPETKGVHSSWLRFAVQKLLRALPEKLNDPVPFNILKTYHLPSLKTSLRAIHQPRDKKEAEAARKRLAFQEIFLIQLDRQKKRLERDQLQANAVKIEEKKIEEFRSSLPYSMTTAQEQAVRIVLQDLSQLKPMSRLLEGDVGSGKTAVAAWASFAAALNEKQVAYMAPTEVLARQIYHEFIERFRQFRISVALATSAEFRKFPSKAYPDKDTHISKSQLLKWLSLGEIPILVGTHALIQDRVKFKNLALTIVDEQHRFGVAQRASLVGRGKDSAGATRNDADKTHSFEYIPHLLSMTATPIPRTLALTIYGDLDLTLLDEMPPGRKKVITIVVPPNQRGRAYEQMRAEILQGRQAYVVCPRIEESSTSKARTPLEVKSVKEEHKKLSENIFPELEVGMLHGRMLPKEKEKVMNDFRENKIQILVATSVIEVGVNVPNATIIMIEGAERFGLAQLHQLRGRVLRSTYLPYCFLFSESPSQKSMERLKALIHARTGFELAEYDLHFRGPGELSGAKQWGVSDIGMEALKNIKMVEAARLEARKLLQKDFELAAYPRLRALLPRFGALHFE